MQHIAGQASGTPEPRPAQLRERGVDGLRVIEAVELELDPHVAWRCGRAENPVSAQASVSRSTEEPAAFEAAPPGFEIADVVVDLEDWHLDLSFAFAPFDGDGGARRLRPVNPA